MLFKVALASLLSRRGTAALTVASLVISISVVLAVELVRSEARTSFSRTVSGIDVIVGARTSPINLLLYSVFHIGNATNNMSWDSYQHISQLPAVSWAVPISLGDSHRGYRVVGTTAAYFEHFRYGKQQPLQFAEGQPFAALFDVVLGAEVARKLGYGLGHPVVLAHGMGEVSFVHHDDKPFRVAGILAATGTAVDQSVYVSLGAIEAIHSDWQPGGQLPAEHSPPAGHEGDLTPDAITAMMVGLTSKVAIFGFQRAVNDYEGEPLTAILPGVALSELWQMMSVIEKLLSLIAGLVLLASLLGMITMLLSTMAQRRREIAVLRAVGAPPRFIVALIQFESLLMTWLAFVLAVVLVNGVVYGMQDILSSRFGLYVGLRFFDRALLVYAAVITGTAVILALIPGWSAYRISRQGEAF